jgi:hypothetical protein
MGTETFYKNLQAFDGFELVTERGVYSSAPDDWLVVITDVIGSTRAIEEGRYQDVNVLGASSLMAVLNAVEGLSVPYVFGGDGATLLIPSSVRKSVENALRGAKNLAQQKFNLDLRIGIVPLTEIRKRGADVLVAKHRVGPTASIGVFSGGGATLAEKLVKSDPLFEIPYKHGQGDANFLGLQCRWDHFPSEQGQILSVIVSANGQSDKKKTYSDFIEMVDNVVGHLNCPITRPALERQIRSKWIRPGKQEYRILSFKKTLLQQLKYRASIIFEMFAFRVMLSKKIKGESFDPEKYLRELPQATDSRKFDDTVRMVIDCTVDQRSKIEHWLNQKQSEGHLCFGLQASAKALMTCLIFNWNNHVHLIDGSEGGYALAAKQLKRAVAAEQANLKSASIPESA